MSHKNSQFQKNTDPSGPAGSTVQTNSTDIDGRAKPPTRWDELYHAPDCDTRTNELICIFLELVRIAASRSPQAIYKETLEDFPVYALRRLNTLFGTDIHINIKPSRAPEPLVKLPGNGKLIL